jgi:hypothetical protein
MSLGEAWWFFDPSSEYSVRRLLELFQSQGLSWRHPSDDSIWVLDETGSRRESSSDFVLKEWVGDERLTMQLWLGPDVDVVVSVEPRGSCLQFAIDGLLLGEALRLVSILVLTACMISGTRALIVDSRLEDEAEKWRHAVLVGWKHAPREADLLLKKDSEGSFIVTVRSKSWIRRALT